MKFVLKLRLMLTKLKLRKQSKSCSRPMWKV